MLNARTVKDWLLKELVPAGVGPNMPWSKIGDGHQSTTHWIPMGWMTINIHKPYTAHRILTAHVALERMKKDKKTHMQRSIVSVWHLTLLDNVFSNVKACSQQRICWVSISGAGDWWHENARPEKPEQSWNLSLLGFKAGLIRGGMQCKLVLAWLLQ